MPKHETATIQFAAHSPNARVHAFLYKIKRNTDFFCALCTCKIQTDKTATFRARQNIARVLQHSAPIFRNENPFVPKRPKRQRVFSFVSFFSSADCKTIIWLGRCIRWSEIRPNFRETAAKFCWMEVWLSTTTKTQSKNKTAKVHQFRSMKTTKGRANKYYRRTHGNTR